MEITTLSQMFVLVSTRNRVSKQKIEKQDKTTEPLGFERFLPLAWQEFLACSRDIGREFI